jgi:CP family cyanate transporter-like MFS transporter
MTFVMGVGIAISQPTMPALVRQWFPGSITRATGVWTGGLLVGEFVGAAATLTLVYPLVGGQWDLALAFWAIPVVATIAFMVLTELRHQGLSPEPGRGTVTGWPDWRRANVWQLGLLQSSTSLIYFGANTFLPDYLHTNNHAALIAPALAVLNLSQIPASFVVGLLPWRILSHNGFLLSLSALVLAGLPGLLSDQPAVVLGAAALLGFSSACVLVVVLALPALLAETQDVARLSAGSSTIGYSVAFVTNLTAGAIWDSTHVAASGFLPVLAGAALILLLGPRLVSSAVAARTADR